MNKDDLKKQYFAMRDAAYKAETGFTKAELHHLFKSTIFPLLADEDENWEEDISEQEIVSSISPSINWLSEKGLQKFNEQCRSFINDHFGIAV